MKEILEHLGLSPTEAKVYLALLEIDEATASAILRNAKLNSGRIYDVLAALEEKGFVSSIIKKGTKIFTPAPPECVYQYLDAQEQSLQEKRKEFDAILPALSKRFAKIKNDARVEVFFGPEGLRNSYALLFKEGKKGALLYVYGVSSKKRYSKMFINTTQFYVYKERARLKLHVRKLAAEEARGDAFFLQDNSEIRYIPHPTALGIEVLGSVTRIAYETEPFIVINVYSTKIADEFRRHYDFLWKIAKR